MQKGIFAVLVLIAFLLGANLFDSKESHAAKTIKYHAVGVKGGRDITQKALDDYSRDGYELVAIDANYGVYIFKKL